jgi:hypothetical protein
MHVLYKSQLAILVALKRGGRFGRFPELKKSNLFSTSVPGLAVWIVDISN